MKLSHRITLFSTVFLFILLLIVNTSIYLLFHHYSLNAELDRSLSQARTVAEAIHSSGNEQANINEFLQASVPESGMIRVVRESEDVPIFVTKEVVLNNIETKFTQQETTAQISFQDQLFAHAKTPAIWEDGSIVTLEVIAPMTIYEETLAMLRVILLLASILIIIPSYLAGRALSRFILLPIQSLVKTMNEIRKEGAFKKISVNPSSKDELSEMGTTFNHMIDLLKENFEKQKQFVSDASHELKTPLTVITSYSRLLKRWGLEKPEVLEEAVQAIDSESKRMNDMTKQMLALAKGETEESLDFSHINLCSLTTDTAKKLEVVYQRTIRVQCEGEALSAYVDEGKIKQLLFILFENGLKYSDDGLDVTVKRVAGRIEITVRDYGIGIPTEDVERVFERFFRVDKARNRKSGGTGLGLSIAKSIVTVHKGTIQVDSEEGEGATFTVRIPAKREVLE
ncbi:sensor histidine kinase [Alteribacter populi]|uniref:sensor histidine kinase n=1 Tax=Alteribacter populi TaxID=2011011 RepID=UPI000BBA6D54|nr:HAMP domain-containing sensor histidine kinase [Alteribacter populi]